MFAVLRILKFIAPLKSTMFQSDIIRLKIGGFVYFSKIFLEKWIWIRKTE